MQVGAGKQRTAVMMGLAVGKAQRVFEGSASRGSRDRDMDNGLPTGPDHRDRHTLQQGCSAMQQ